MDLNRLPESQDTSAGNAAAGAAWSVGACGAGTEWQPLPPGGTVDLAQQPGSGLLDRLDLRLGCASGRVDRSQLLLQWECSPVPDRNEAGARPRLIDGIVPLSALCGDGLSAAPRTLRRAGDDTAYATAGDDGAGEHTFSLRLPMAYNDGLRLRLVYPALAAAAQPVCRCQWRAQGRAGPPPADRRYLRAQWLAWFPPSTGAAAAPGLAPAVADVEFTLFETHGQGQVEALIAVGGAAAAPENWVLTWYLDGDERLQRIEERSGARLWGAGARDERHVAAEALPAFAEYVKGTLRWATPPAAGEFAGLLVLAKVEDRPIA